MFLAGRLCVREVLTAPCPTCAYVCLHVCVCVPACVFVRVRARACYQVIAQPEGVLISLSIDMVLKIWDYAKGTVLWETRHEGEDITCMAYDKGKKTLVCGTAGCTLITLDVPNLESLLRVPDVAVVATGDIEEEIEGEGLGRGEAGGEGDGEVVEEDHDQPAEEQP
jgi:hypothetical protein